MAWWQPTLSTAFNRGDSDIRLPTHTCKKFAHATHISPPGLLARTILEGNMAFFHLLDQKNPLWPHAWWRSDEGPMQPGILVLNPRVLTLGANSQCQGRRHELPSCSLHIHCSSFASITTSSASHCGSGTSSAFICHGGFCPVILGSWGNAGKTLGMGAPKNQQKHLISRGYFLGISVYPLLPAKGPPSQGVPTIFPMISGGAASQNIS